MSDVQHVIDDLTQVNSIVRHAITDVHTKLSTLVQTLEGQAKADAAEVLDIVHTIKAAAHSTASLATAPEPVAVSTPVLNPPVDVQALAAEAAQAEDDAAQAEDDAATAAPVDVESKATKRR